MRVCRYYFCSARCGSIAIPAYRKSAFGGKPGEPWPVESVCPRCGAKAFDGSFDGPGKELYWEAQSIIHRYHDRYLSEHPELPPRKEDQLQSKKATNPISDRPTRSGGGIYLLAHGQAVDITDRFLAHAVGGEIT